MSAMEHPDQIRAMRSAAQTQEADVRQAAFATRWAVLHNEAAEIGRLAALAKEPPSDQITGFPERIADAGGTTEHLARQGLEDIHAMIAPGLAALREISARGQEPTAPALALWREFHAARQALFSLCQR